MNTKFKLSILTASIAASLGISQLAYGDYGINPLPINQNDKTVLKQELTIDDNTSSAQSATSATVTSTANKPSWCDNGNLNNTESAICASSDLWTLDATMNQVYSQNRPTGQGTWRAERDSCGNDDNCIKQSYTDRLAKISGGQSVQPLSVASSQQPSWCNNGKSQNKTEQLICSDPELSALDVQMETLYFQGWHGKKAQRAFISQRDDCGTKECIKDAYENRIKELGGGDFQTQSVGTTIIPSTISTPNGGVVSFELSQNHVALKDVLNAINNALTKHTYTLNGQTRALHYQLPFAIGVIHGRADKSNIMQVSGKTARQHGCGDISTVQSNVDCGVKILTAIANEYGNDASKVVAVYLTGGTVITPDNPLFTQYIGTIGAIAILYYVNQGAK